MAVHSVHISTQMYLGYLISIFSLIHGHTLNKYTIQIHLHFELSSWKFDKSLK